MLTLPRDSPSSGRVKWSEAAAESSASRRRRQQTRLRTHCPASCPRRREKTPSRGRKIRSRKLDSGAALDNCESFRKTSPEDRPAASAASRDAPKSAQTADLRRALGSVTAGEILCLVVAQILSVNVTIIWYNTLCSNTLCIFCETPNALLFALSPRDMRYFIYFWKKWTFGVYWALFIFIQATLQCRCPLGEVNFLVRHVPGPSWTFKERRKWLLSQCCRL